MAFDTWTLAAVESPGTRVELHPGPQFAEIRDAPVRHVTTLGGAVHSHRINTTRYTWALPLDYVTSADRQTLVSSWWRGEKELHITFNQSGGATARGAYVRINNMQEPLPMRSGVTIDRFSGNLFLEETRGHGPLPGVFLILDDAAFGKMDTNGIVLG